jgi:hypothetical protein
LIPTPTAGAPPTGTFALTLSTPSEIQSACLVSPDQQIAWDCDIVPNDALAINVTMNNGSLGANIFYASADKNIVYGAQAPDMITPFAQFLSVRDNDAPDAGPAYYFAGLYNKVVVVPQDAFDPDEKKFKRGYDYTAELDQRTTVAPGSFPWFCVWNNTLLEGFIYIEKNSNVLGAATTALSTSFTATPTTTFPTSPQPSSFTTTASFGPGSSAVFTGPSSEYGSWLSVHRASATARASAGNGNQARQAASDPWSQFAKYPYGIKLEERRTPGSSSSPAQAYCQQYQILWDGHANWRPSPIDQKPIKVWLDEQDPAYAAYKSTGIAVGGRYMRRARDVVSTGCHCQWTSGL